KDQRPGTGNAGIAQEPGIPTELHCNMVTLKYGPMTNGIKTSFCRTNLATTFLLSLTLTFSALAQDKTDSIAQPKENDYYEIRTVPIPEGIFLGVGGMVFLPNDKLAVCTRRGEVWTISDPYMKDGMAPSYKLFARGLHEPLGLTYHDGSLYLAQRPELTRLTDL